MTVLPDPPQVPQKALETLAELRRRELDTDTELRAAVSAARSQGATWEAIAQALGMTRQNANKRFGKR